MTGVAVKVTLAPEQMVVADARTDTAGVSVLLTVMVTGEEVAEVGVAHDSVEVITQVITSPLAKPALVYVALFEPTLPPLSNH